MISVVRRSDDGLSQERWAFDYGAPYGGLALRLVGFYREARKQPRGRFNKADPRDQWEANDERYYNSGIERPTAIPQDVIDEAWASIPRSVFIGWYNEESRYAPQSAKPI